MKAAAGQDVQQLKQRIQEETHLSAYTPSEFSWHTIDYWVKQTGIPINFGIAITLGFFVGVAISGQMFYNFTLDNLRYFGALKAMGARTRLLLLMVLPRDSPRAPSASGLASDSRPSSASPSRGSAGLQAHLAPSGDRRRGGAGHRHRRQPPLHGQGHPAPAR